MDALLKNSDGICPGRKSFVRDLDEPASNHRRQRWRQFHPATFNIYTVYVSAICLSRETGTIGDGSAHFMNHVAANFPTNIFLGP